MNFSTRFFKYAAVCSMVSAATTLGLIFLPQFYPEPKSFDEAVALHADSVYRLRLWIYFAHPFFVLTAAWGVAAKKLRTAAGAVSTGFIFFALWAFTEAAQQSLSIIANNYAWRTRFASETDPAVKVLLHANLFGFEAVWDALYVLLLFGFLLGNLLYGAATARGKGLEKIVGLFYLAAFGLTALNIAETLWGVPDWLSRGTSWLYPILQPAARFLIGVWLWRTLTPVTDPEN